jgi:high-affinity nickel permease
VPTLLSSILLGFLLGMRHATDADHVIAVATIVGREKRIGAAALVGALWGLGHTVTVAIVGGAMILTGVVIPDLVARTMEFGVGIMLVVLGANVLLGMRREPPVRYVPAALAHPHVRPSSIGRPPKAVHAHVHAHGDYAHAHRHGHSHQDHGHPESATPAAWLDRHLGRLGVYQSIRPIVIGVVHGLAGSAAVALLVLGAIRDPWWGLAYLFVFGLGTIAGMMLITALIAVPFSLSWARLPRINHVLRIASGLLSLGLGLFLMYEIGIAGGLIASLVV